MADDAAGAVGGTATKARGAKKKGGKGKAGGRFKKMEKRRGTGIVVLDVSLFINHYNVHQVVIIFSPSGTINM